MIKKIFKDNINIDLNDHQIKLFDLYYEKLIDYNKHTNLTRITLKEDVYIKHFLDSVMPSRLIDFNKVNNMCDLGSGAGFPAIPLLIVYPHLKMTLVDSQIKRISFLKELKDTLNLDYNIIHERAENYSRLNQQKYDVVTARALTELNKILEFGIPLLKPKGYLITLKGIKYDDEINSSKNALNTLKSSVLKTDTFELPNDAGFRANLLIRKDKHIAGYPREYNQILKKPL